MMCVTLIKDQLVVYYVSAFHVGENDGSIWPVDFLSTLFKVDDSVSHVFLKKILQWLTFFTVARFISSEKVAVCTCL